MYFEFEHNYDTVPGLEFAKNHPYMPLVIVACYIGGCSYGSAYMATRKAFDLRGFLSYWNLALSVFSYIGATRTVPHLLYNLTTMSLRENLCNESRSSFGTGATGLWVQLFIFSKIPELFDTFFIIARKKPLLFLHWYHHITVLLFCWHSYATEASTGLFFVSMNYSVHAVMYGYYYLMAIESRPRWLNPAAITFCQISQMVIGTALCMMSYGFLGDNCAVKVENVIAGGLMYGSYLYLFCEFAVKRFVKRQVYSEELDDSTRVRAIYKKN
jgi:elongation of very long chain fatty acids protein 6